MTTLPSLRLRSVLAGAVLRALRCANLGWVLGFGFHARCSTGTMTGTMTGRPEISRSRKKTKTHNGHQTRLGAFLSKSQDDKNSSRNCAVDGAQSRRAARVRHKTSIHPLK